MDRFNRLVRNRDGALNVFRAAVKRLERADKKMHDAYIECEETINGCKNTITREESAQAFLKNEITKTSNLKDKINGILGE